MNEQGGEFSDERLIACVTANLGKSPSEVLDALFADVRGVLRRRADQSDDITAVLVRYNG